MRIESLKITKNSRYSIIMGFSYVLLIQFLLLSSESYSIVSGASFLSKRSVDTNSLSRTEICLYDSPCGWEVYNPDTRDHQYYVASSCTCPTSQKCILTSDDLTISAYVYNCRIIPQRKTKSKNRRINRNNSNI